MNKVELASAMAEKTGESKKLMELAIRAFMESVSEELADGGSVRLIGFGSFDVVERAERKGHNPKTREEIIISAHKVPRFKAGKGLKDSVNN